jgi:hypothetical protein
VHPPALVTFLGTVPSTASPLERLVGDAWAASTLDLLALAASSNLFERAVLVTENAELANTALREAATWQSALPLDIEAHAGDSFHFGDSLLAVCRTYSFDRIVYVGGGSMPLATEQTLQDLVTIAGGDSPCVAANNPYSADIVAFWPASALERISLPPTDNDLAWRLHYEAGLPFAPLPHTLATSFDIDTPTDLAILWWSTQSSSLTSGLGPRLSSLLSDLPDRLPTLSATVERAYKAMATLRAEILVVGRVSSWVWRRLEINLPCQTRVVSEERGMQASGREQRGEVHSILGSYADLAGIDGLIHLIEQTSNAAFLDSRVLFAHRHLTVSRADRFASDALMPDLVSDPWVRELTQATANASLPIILGGHSLISGGLWALSERVRSSASSSG